MSYTSYVIYELKIIYKRLMLLILILNVNT